MTKTARRKSVGIIFVCLSLLMIPVTALAVKSVSVYALFNGRAILVIDGQKRMLKEGETSPEGLTLISSTTQSALIDVDGRKEQLDLKIVPSTGPVSGPDDGLSEFDKNVVTLDRSSSGFFYADGEINNRPVRFLVDTGANNIAMSASMARSLDIDFENGKKSLATTANGIVPMYLIKLDKVTVGSIELENVETSIISDPGPNEVLLGMSFLGQLKVEHSGDRMILTQP